MEQSSTCGRKALGGNVEPLPTPNCAALAGRKRCCSPKVGPLMIDWKAKCSLPARLVCGLMDQWAQWLSLDDDSNLLG